MKHILCLSIVLTLGISLVLLTLQEFQAKLANIITPVLIISDIIFLISAILFDILYLPLFQSIMLIAIIHLINQQKTQYVKSNTQFIIHYCWSDNNLYDHFFWWLLVQVATVVDLIRNPNDHTIFKPFIISFNIICIIISASTILLLLNVML